MRRSQYVHLYEAVRVPFDRARTILSDRSIASLESDEPVRIPAFHEGDLSLELEVAGFHLEKEAHFEVSDYVDIAGHLPLGRVQLRWIPADGSGLVPPIAAELEIEPIDDARTMVSLLANYEPPLGRIGTLMDRVAMHRIADTALKRYFDRLVGELEKAA